MNCTSILCVLNSCLFCGIIGRLDDVIFESTNVYENLNDGIYFINKCKKSIEIIYSPYTKPVKLQGFNDLVSFYSVKPPLVACA